MPRAVDKKLVDWRQPHPLERPVKKNRISLHPGGEPKIVEPDLRLPRAVWWMPRNWRRPWRDKPGLICCCQSSASSSSSACMAPCSQCSPILSLPCILHFTYASSDCIDPNTGVLGVYCNATLPAIFNGTNWVSTLICDGVSHNTIFVCGGVHAPFTLGGTFAEATFGASSSTCNPLNIVFNTTTSSICCTTTAHFTITVTL